MSPYLRRQLAYAALTANAVRPVPGFRTGVASFLAGWITTELAPHWLAVTAGDAAAHLSSRRRDPAGLALAAVTAAGLAHLIRQSRADRQVAEQALQDALGPAYADRLDHAPTPAELATPWRALVNPFRATREVRTAVHVESDIAFGEAGGRNVLDVYTPVRADGEPLRDAPVLLQIHGGAWVLGRKDQQGIPLMRHLAARGWVCVAINYRLAPRDPWPAQIVDVKRAIAWIKEHIAAYGGDPGYLAITGGSAGGHLAALAALTAGDPAYQPGFEDADTTVHVAVPHYGVYDMAGVTGTRSAVRMRDDFLAPKVFPRPFRDDPAAYEQASPLLRVTADAPDFFVVHGGHDSVVPVDQARAFVARLREESAGVVVYAELPGAQHAFDVFGSIRSAHLVRAVDRFLHWHWGEHRRAQGASDGEPTQRASAT